MLCVCVRVCAHQKVEYSTLQKLTFLITLQCQYKPTVASLVAEVYKQVNTQEILAYCGTKLDLSTGATDKQRLAVGVRQ